MIKMNSVLGKSFLSALLIFGIFACIACAGEEPETSSVILSEVQEIPPEDEEVTDAVELELMLDKGVSAHLIDVETTEGVVTLSGSVDNILAKERAERITETIKGVRSVVNTIKVEPVERKDREVLQDVENALLMDPATESYEVDVGVKDGTVTLTGNVESLAEKRLAAYVAKGVKGVKKVENNISIDYETIRADSEIKSDIERQLEIDSLIDDEMIDVKVEDQKVTLSGTVGSAMEKNRVYNLSWAAGVEEVDDSALEVKFWARDEQKRRERALKSDAEIKEAVQDALLYDPRVYLFEIQVDVEDGLVTLEGEVDNLKAREAAEKDALNTTGVWGVENEITVRPVTPVSDKQIAENVKDALLWNPIVERFDLNVVVRNKKVYLYGRVDNAYEKREAGDVVFRTKGVVAVENHIQVDEVWEWKSDKKVKKDIQEQFSWSIFVDDDEIDVTVENGVVTLEGEVDSITELDAAIKDAFEGGAKRVVNRLTVEGYPEYYPDLYFQEYWWPYWPFWSPGVPK